MPDEVLPEAIVPPEAQAGHPLAVAAKLGFGPLSDQARSAWHGSATPCASCAQLVQRDAIECPHCGQDLRREMLEKMARHSGPWFVYDNIRPFPGVSLERIVRQIKRGVLQRTTIIRGPTTFSQWRFAGETPLIAKLLGCCWQCQARVLGTERFCPQCKVVLDGYYRSDEEATATPSSADSFEPGMPQLAELSRALQDSGVDTNLTHLTHRRDAPLGKTALIFLGVAVVVVGLLVAIVSLGSRDVPLAPASSSVQPQE